MTPQLRNRPKILAETASAAASSSAHRVNPHWHWWVIFILILGELVAIHFAVTGLPDTERDLASAYLISSGQQAIWLGPQLNSQLHLGPVWFYLLSIPLMAFKSTYAVHLMVAFLAAMKFPLAYLCGRHLADRRMGLLWALLLTLPDWETVQAFTFTHTSLTATLMLWFCLLALRAMRNPGGFRLPFLMLIYSLCLHAHPTTAALGLLLLPVVLKSVRNHPRGGAVLTTRIMLAIAAFSLPFIPALIMQWQGVGGVLQTSDTQSIIDNLLSAHRVIIGSFIYAPLIAGRYFLDLTDGAVMALCIAAGGIVLTGLSGMAGAFADLRLRRYLLVGLLLLLATILLISAIRPVTPFYTAYAIYPLSSGLLAAGLWMISGRRSGLFTLCWLMPLLLNLVILTAISRAASDGIYRFPLALTFDIKHWKLEPEIRLPHLPAYQRGPLAQKLCNRAEKPVLHGHLAFLTDAQSSLDMQLKCGTGTKVSLLGADHSRLHAAGFTRGFWSALDLQPDEWIHGIGMRMMNLKVVHPDKPLPSATGNDYLGRGRIHETAQGLSLDIVLVPEDVLVISQLAPFSLSSDIASVTVNKRPVKPVYSDLISNAYRCGDCIAGDDAVWSLELLSARPEWIEVIVLSAKK